MLPIYHRRNSVISISHEGLHLSSMMKFTCIQCYVLELPVRNVRLFSKNSLSIIEDESEEYCQDKVGCRSLVCLNIKTNILSI